MKSIRRYLLRSLILALIAGSLLVTSVAYIHATEEIDDLYNTNMEMLATTLQVELEALLVDHHGVTGLAGPSLADKLRHEEEFLIQIWSPHGQLLYTSHRAIPLPKQSSRGMVMTQFQNRDWRSYVLETEDFQIQISQPLKVRVRFVREMALSLFYPLLALIPIVGFLICLAVTRSLAPLEMISNAIHERTATSLQPLPENAIPREVRPIVLELNALLSRLKLSLDTQRRFTADAAHELRSPLTALQLQLDILNRAQNDEERTRASSKLQEGIERATHLVRQLLTLARMEPDATDHLHTPLNLADLAKETVERYREQAATKSIALTLSRTEPAYVYADQTALLIAVSNLVDNALRYTPQGGKVEVRTYTQDQDAVMEVCDTGIGIAEYEHSRVFERFYRVIGTNTEGTGLGLSITQSIVEQHHGTITIGTGLEGKGTCFTLRFAYASSPDTI